MSALCDNFSVCKRFIALMILHSNKINIIVYNTKCIYKIRNSSFGDREVENIPARSQFFGCYATSGGGAHS